MTLNDAVPFSSHSDAVMSGATQPEVQALRAMFQIMVSGLLQDVPCECAVVYVFEEHTQDLVCFDTFNIEPRRPVDTIRFNVHRDQSLAVDVWKNREYRYVENIQRSTMPVDPNVAIDIFGLEHYALAGLPTVLKFGGDASATSQPNGVVVVFNSPNMPPLAQSELDQFHSFADSAAVAIFMAQSSMRHREALHDAYEEKSRFLRQVVHSFRTPVASLMAAMDQLPILAADAAQFQELFVPQILRTTRRLDRLIDRFTAYSKLQDGEVGELTPVAIDAVLEESVTSVELSADGCVIQFERQGPNPTVKMNAENMQLALEAVLQNALNYSGEPTVCVFRYTTDDTVAIDICDYGPGIAEHERARIFDYGFRGKHGATSRPEGTGIGLAIARQVIGLLDGQVCIAEREGFGCVFRIVLPRYDRSSNK